jgi:hypothetical protein
MTIEFAYAQARAQARLAERLAPAAWQVLEASGTLAQYLHAARSTPLRNRVRSLTGTSSPHLIERSLRREWRAEVSGAAGWVPERWRPAVAWTSLLCDLPALAHLGRGGKALPWMADETRLAAFAIDDSALRRHELVSAGLGELDGRDDVVGAWRGHFEALWPAGDPGVRRLGQLVDRLDIYRREPEVQGRARIAAAQSLEALATRLIRRNVQEAATVFTHLLLVALDLGRLRNGLVRRALFGEWLAEA